MPSRTAPLTAPPTAAEVAAYYAFEQAIPRHERDQRQRDLEHAAVVERQQRLQQIAPGVGVAWQIVKGYGMAAIPLDPTALEPVGEAITDPLAVLDHWQANLAHAVGVRLGARPHGRGALVAVKAASWAQWRAWVQATAVTESFRAWDDDYDSGRGEVVRDLKPLGGPLICKWQSPPGPPLRAFSSKGRREMDAAAAQLRKLNAGQDRGGWLCWTVTAADGRLPTLRAHPLDDGLDVLGSGDVLPLWAALPDRSVLTQDGSIREPDPVRDCPAWLLEVFGAKWKAAA